MLWLQLHSNRGTQEMASFIPWGNQFYTIIRTQLSEASYTALFTGLKKRGLKNVWLAVSDAHQGLVSAIKKSFVGCSWQRCKVHFMRNILVHVPAKDKESFAAKLKQIWQQPDYESAKRYAELLIEEYEARFPKAVEVLA